MSLTTTDVKKVYQPDGVETSFELPFRIFAPEGLECITVDSLGREEKLTDFSVSGYGTSAQRVVFATPPPAGKNLVIRRATPAVTDSKYPEAGRLPTKTLEGDLDRLMGLVQELFAQAALALKAPADSEKSEYTATEMTKGMEAMVATTTALTAEAGRQAGEAAAAALEAVASALLSYKWANNPEDQAVSGGEFSAYHWMRKARDISTSGPVVTPEEKGLAPAGGYPGAVLTFPAEGVQAVYDSLVGVPAPLANVQAGVKNTEHRHEFVGPVEHAASHKILRKLVVSPYILAIYEDAIVDAWIIDGGTGGSSGSRYENAAGGVGGGRGAHVYVRFLAQAGTNLNIFVGQGGAGAPRSQGNSVAGSPGGYSRIEHRSGSTILAVYDTAGARNTAYLSELTEEGENYRNLAGFYRLLAGTHPDNKHAGYGGAGGVGVTFFRAHAGLDYALAGELLAQAGSGETITWNNIPGGTGGFGPGAGGGGGGSASSTSSNFYGGAGGTGRRGLVMWTLTPVPGGLPFASNM